MANTSADHPEAEAPAWARLRRALLAEAAAWPDPARRFHSEAEIAARHGVSRVTVRRALAALAEAGVLTRVRGSGSFVRPAPLAEHITPTMQVDQGWRELGRAPETRVLACRPIRADAAAARALGLARGARLLFIKRLRLAGGVPLAIDERLIPAEVAARCGLDVGSAAGSIIGLLWKAGPLDTGRWSIAARPPVPAEAMLLAIGPAQPVLVRRMEYLGAAGRVVLTGQSVHRGDLMRYTLSLPLRRASTEEPMRAEVAEG